MTANERRIEILKILIRRKKESVANLAFEFGVSNRTIKYDIEILSLMYPIGTKTGKYGGIYIDPDYYIGREYLTLIEKQLLEEQIERLDVEKQKIMQNILRKFSRPETNKKGERNE